MQVKTTKTLSDLSNYGQENVIKLGKVVYESLQSQGIDVKEQLAEKAGVSKEDLTVAETDLYTTSIAGFIEKRLRPKLVAEGVIKKISNFNTRGANSVKIPLRNALISAVDLPDSGAVTYDTGSYESTTVTLAYSYAAQSLTHEIVKFANVDLIAEELGEIGDALKRKVDSDIISALQSATTTPNGNLVQLGATATVTWDNLVDGQASALGNYAEPDVVLLAPSTMATIMKLDEFSGGNSITGAMSFNGQEGTVFPAVTSILGMRVVTSNQVDADDIYLIDTARTGYLIESGDVEVFDGRRSGYLAYEVIGAKCYGIGIVQPKAIYRIEENA